MLFALRHVDASDLVALASTAQPKANDTTATDKVLDDSALADVFGIEMVDFSPPPQKKALKKPAARDLSPYRDGRTG